MSTQPGWRWCQKCEGLFFAGNPNQGTCPKDRQAHDGSQSGHYAAVFGDVADTTDFQNGWRWCHKCQGFYFAGGASQGTCPKDRQAHDGSQSSRYAAVFGDGALTAGTIQIPFGQGGWRWCHKCQGLFFAGSSNQGFCPKDGHAHDPSQSARYAMWWDFPKPTSRQLDSGWLTSDLPLGGNLQVVMNDNGDFDFKSHAHDSGFDNIDYTVSAVIMTPDAFAFTFQHSGHVEGTVAGLPFGTPNRDDDFVAPAANNPLIGSHWDGILQGQLSARLDGTDTLLQGVEGALGDLVKSAAQQVGAAAAKAVIALVL